MMNPERIERTRRESCPIPPPCSIRSAKPDSDDEPYIRDPSVTINLFSSFVKKDHNGKLDVTDIVSKECFEVWKKSRKMLPKHPPNAFRKAVTGHIRGDKGLRPFEPDVEQELLKLLRKRQIWPCFEFTEYRIGERGCKTIGFWEAKRKESEPKIPLFLTHSALPNFLQMKLTGKQTHETEIVDNDVMKLYNVVCKSNGVLSMEAYEKLNAQFNSREKRRNIILTDSTPLKES